MLNLKKSNGDNQFMAGSSLGTSYFLTALNFNHNHPLQNYSCCIQGDICNTNLVITPKQ